MLTFLKDLWARIKKDLDSPYIRKVWYSDSTSYIPQRIEAGELRKEIELKKDEWVKLDMEDESYKALIRELGKR
jgi:hypothetical protein